jgi:hypothetical protein
MKTPLLTFACALSLCAQVPPQYQALYSYLPGQMSSFDSTVKGAPKYPTLYTPQLDSASAQLYTSLLNRHHFPAVLAEIQEFKALGANGVTIHMGLPILYRPFYETDADYQAYVNFYSQVAAALHADGLAIIIECETEDAVTGEEGSPFAAFYQSFIGNWSGYMDARAANAVAVARLMQPSLISLIHEPDSEARISGQANANIPADSNDMLQRIENALTGNGLTTPIAAGAGTWHPQFTEFLQMFATDPGVSALDMHVYPIIDDLLPNLVVGFNIAHANGKTVGMSEEWLHKQLPTEGNIPANTIFSRDPYSFWQPLDIQFIDTLNDFCNYSKALFISPAYFGQGAFAYVPYSAQEDAKSPGVRENDWYDVGATTQMMGSTTQTGRAYLIANLGAPEVTPPSTPPTPTAESVGNDSAVIRWTNGRDNVGVSGYKVFRNGSLVTTTSAESFYNQGLQQNSTYEYTLQSFDAFGNLSPESGTLTITTF